MPLPVWILLFCLFGGALSVVAAAGFLRLGRLAERRLPDLVSFATGALLGTAFLALLPHALEEPGAPGAHRVMGAVLLGVLAFFALEKFVLWRHCHAPECDAHGPGEPAARPAAGALILVGDAFHNFVDGVLIAAAFLADIHLGIVTALAVAAHEIPQEVGDFAILLHSGYTRARAFAYNLISGLATVAGGLLGWAALAPARGALAYVLAVAAASFVYIAVADLIPDLHRRLAPGETARQLALIALGVGVVALGHTFAH